MINIDEVKQYNAELKKNKEKSSMLKAQLDLYEKELATKCDELSRELGIQVTKDNIREVYAEYEKKVEQTLSTGMAVLRKIAQVDSQSAGTVQASANNVQQGAVQMQTNTGAYQQAQTGIVQGNMNTQQNVTIRTNGNLPIGATVTPGQFFQI